MGLILHWVGIVLVIVMVLGALGMWLGFVYEVVYGLAAERGHSISRIKAGLITVLILIVLAVVMSNKSCERWIDQSSEDASEQ
jgi:hypothetical protein